MCLELLLAASKAGRGIGRLLRHRRRRSLCDLGCGSGVLAIAAAKLGFAPVLGIDFESAALEECDRNARLNYVEVEPRMLDLRTEAPPRADVVTANLTAGLLENVAESWAMRGDRPEIVIASGAMTSELDRVLASMKNAGLHDRRRLARGDWSAFMASAANVLP
jgi:ribosomal protein L11 methyltransferase